MHTASFNLENLTDAVSAEVPLSARLDVLKPQLNRLHADIICFQEIDATKRHSCEQRQLNALDILIEGTELKKFYRATTINKKAGHPADRHNLVTLSRWPIHHVAQYANDFVSAPSYQYTTAKTEDTNESKIFWDRPILVTKIELPHQKSLYILNIHLKAPLASVVPGQKTGQFTWNSVPGWAEGYFVAGVKRARQALECRMIVDQIFDEDSNALIAVIGDFNCEEREVPLRIIAGRLEDTCNGRLAGRTLALLEHSTPKSQRFTVIHRGNKMMMDHILVSQQLMAYYRSFEAHNEILTDELVAYTLIDSAPNSFHAPIIAHFKMDA